MSETFLIVGGVLQAVTICFMLFILGATIALAVVRRLLGQAPRFFKESNPTKAGKR